MKAATQCRITHKDGVLHVLIDRAQKRNALSSAILGELRSIFTAHAGDDGLRFAVLTSAGDKCFAAGGDIHELESVKGTDAAAAMATESKAALSAIRSFPVPVIAGLNGDALGGGAELSVACDMRLAATHVRIGFIQGRLAIATAWGGGVDLMRLVGRARALQLLCRSEMVSVPQALEYGLINDAAVDGETLDEVLDRFTAPMLKQAPQVMRAFKALHLHQNRVGRDELDALETLRFSETWAHPDHNASVERLLTPTE